MMQLANAYKSHHFLIVYLTLSEQNFLDRLYGGCGVFRA